MHMRTVSTLTTEVIEIPGGISDYAQVLVSVAQAGGEFVAETMPFGGGAWDTVAQANPESLASGYAAIRIDGPIAAVRLTFSGVTPSTASVWIVPMVMPAGTFSGLAAITTQPYTEANVKRGVQYYLRAGWPMTDQIPAGESRHVWIKTGAARMTAKLREVTYSAEELRLDLYRNPTGVTGGTVLKIGNYNIPNPVPTTVQAKKNVSVTTLGDLLDIDSEYFFGSTQSNFRQGSAISAGRERILAPNGEYLATFVNTGSSAARVQYFLDWYEGDSDVPV